MAKLDVYLPDGHVTETELHADWPLVIGSHAQCDVVIPDSRVRPVHCRVSSGRAGFRVECAGDADDVELNGRAVRSAAMQPGDELRIGKARLVLVVEEQQVTATSGRQPSDEDEAVEPLPEEPEEAVQKTAAGRRPIAAMWEDLDVGRYSEPGMPVFTRGRPQPRRWWQAWKRASASEGGGAAAPGHESLVRSPIVLSLVGGLAALALVGAALWLLIFRRDAEQQFELARKAMTERQYTRAMSRFDTYLKDYPRHELAGQARALRALCEVRHFSEGASPSWPNALKAARQMLDDVGDRPAMKDIERQFAESLGTIARGLAQEARDEANPERITQAEEALSLVRETEASDTKAEQEVVRILAAARATIAKTRERGAVLAAMKAAIAAGNPLEAYARRDRLVRQHPELGNDADLVRELERAGEVERTSVQWHAGRPAAAPGSVAPAEIHALTEERPAAVAATTTLLAGVRGSARSSGNGEVVFALAGSACYALDADTGKVLWRRVVGADATTLPTPISGRGGLRVLLIDMRHDELVMVEGRTGKLVWRQAVGAAVESAPLVHADRIYVPTRQGHLFLLDQASGRVEGHVTFPQAPAVAPVADAAGERLYVVGEYSSLYAVSLNSRACEAVFYVGHAAESVRAAPLRLGEYLVLCENDRLNGCRVRVLLCGAKGSISEVQQIELAGWVCEPPVAVGNTLWLATSQGAVHAYSVSPAATTKPVSLVAEVKRAADAGMQPYVLGWSEREAWVAGRRAERYVLAAQKQQVESAWSHAQDGAASQPIQVRGEAVFFAERRPPMTGIFLTAVSARTNSPLWEVHLGTGLWTAPVGVGRTATASAGAEDGKAREATDKPAIAIAGATRATAAAPSSAPAAQAAARADRWLLVTRAGDVFEVGAELVGRSLFLAEPGRRVTTREEFRLGEGIWIDTGKFRIASAGFGGREVLVWAKGEGATQGAPRALRLPAELMDLPAPLGGGLLVPGTDQRLYLISVDSGEQLAVPFQPPLDRRQAVRWRGPAVVDGKWIVAADGRGTLYQVVLGREPVPHLEAQNQVSLAKPARSPMAVAGRCVYFFDDGNGLQAFAAENLSRRAQWEFGATPTAGPWAAADHVFAQVGADEVLCFTGDGELRWRQRFDGGRLAGPPVANGDRLYFAQRGGTVRTVALGTGKELASQEVGEPLAGGPWILAGHVVVASEDGTLNVMKAPAETTAPTAK